MPGRCASACRPSSSQGSSSRGSCRRRSRSCSSSATRTTSRLKDLRQEADGLAQLYATRPPRRSNEPRRFSLDKLEQATGDRIYYMGLPLYPGRGAGLPPLPPRYLAIGAPADRAAPSRSRRRGRARLHRGRPPGVRSARLDLRRARRRDADTALRDGWLTLLGCSRSRSRRHPRRRRARAGTSRGGSRGPCSPSRAADEVALATTRCSCRPRPAAARSSTLRSASARWRRLGEAEELERNFLMTVSHELRTPLTAIRGHVEALREGLATTPRRARSRSTCRGGGGPPRAARRRPARPGEARGAPLHRHREEVDMGSSSSRRTRRSGRRRGGAGSTTAATIGREPVIVSDGDRVLQIIGNLLRTPSAGPPTAVASSSRWRRRTATSRSRSRTPAPGSGPRSASGSSGRSGRGTTAARASASRSRASSPSRSGAA